MNGVHGLVSKFLFHSVKVGQIVMLIAAGRVLSGMMGLGVVFATLKSGIEDRRTWTMMIVRVVEDVSMAGV